MLPSTCADTLLRRTPNLSITHGDSLIYCTVMVPSSSETNMLPNQPAITCILWRSRQSEQQTLKANEWHDLPTKLNILTKCEHQTSRNCQYERDLHLLPWLGASMVLSKFALSQATLSSQAYTAENALIVRLSTVHRPENYVSSFILEKSRR